MRSGWFLLCDKSQWIVGFHSRGNSPRGPAWRAFSHSFVLRFRLPFCHLSSGKSTLIDKCQMLKTLSALPLPVAYSRLVRELQEPIRVPRRTRSPATTHTYTPYTHPLQPIGSANLLHPREKGKAKRIIIKLVDSLLPPPFRFFSSFLASHIKTSSHLGVSTPVSATTAYSGTFLITAATFS